ncbi:hypothetical protein [Streptomyces sp. NPDC093568]|uniref:hypothetical protein n=1 Tax=Streptomyces sp. NPDC093568 TaxID=3366041 RepID=UPI0037F35621
MRERAHTATPAAVAQLSAKDVTKSLTGTGKDPRQGFGKHRRSHEAKLGGQVRAARERLELRGDRRC